MVTKAFGGLWPRGGLSARNGAMRISGGPRRQGLANLFKRRQVLREPMPLRKIIGIIVGQPDLSGAILPDQPLLRQIDAEELKGRCASSYPHFYTDSRLLTGLGDKVPRN
jgi:hypothetical protein